jgi:hypothetical protein
MPRDIGPQMLASLDEQLDLGNITPSAHEARRVQVLELIRRGKAIELTRTDRIGIGFESLAALSVGVLMMVAVGIGRATGFLAVVGLALVVVGIVRGVKAFRH